MTPALPLHRCWLLAATLLLAGCASRVPLPAALPPLAVALPAQLHLASADGEREWLAVLVADGEQLRFTLLSPLGAPAARLLVSEGAIARDGFQAPSRANEALLAGLLFALARADALARYYPAAVLHNGARELCFGTPQRCWRSAVQENGWLLQLDAEQWRVRPLPTTFEVEP